MKRGSGSATEQLSMAACIKNGLSGTQRTYFIETFGCQMNERDSETLAGLLSACGYVPAVAMREADLILYNTCCVREHAEQRVNGHIGALKAIKDARPDVVIGVCGCMMQQEGAGERLFRRFPYVDLVFGTHMLDHFCQMLYAVLNGERVLAVDGDASSIVEGLPAVRQSGVSAFVNINYGCDNYCTYCIVPFVRGPERSRQPADILREVEALAAAGCTEVTLLGQNVNSYGHDIGLTFADLLKRVNQITDLRRIRFMTSHPKDLTLPLIEAIRNNDKVCHHVHLPLQSGSDRVLERMNRKYDTARYLDTVHMLRANVPDVEITTDIIVGFPGETDEDFAGTLQMAERVGFSSAFTFLYSPRAGTGAARMPDQVPDAVKRARLHRLNALQERMTFENNKAYLNRSFEVLVEGCDMHAIPTVFGKTGSFKMVYFPGNPDLIGRYMRVDVTGARKSALTGRVAEEESSC